VLALVVAAAACAEPMTGQERIALPPPDRTGSVALEALLDRRRSEREFAERPLELSRLAQVLWAGLGRNRPAGGRTVPSAGALYPLDLYAVAGDVRDLAPGVYRYDPASHTLLPMGPEDRRRELAGAALGQTWIADAPVTLVVAAVYARSTGKYGDRGVRYARIEVGLVAQNVYLQAAALDLGTTFVGAFHDDAVREVLGLPDDVAPLALLPVGTPAPH
jgi:SagB-type dehydrogenase family enzyme